MPFMHIVRTKRLFLCSAALAWPDGQPISAQIPPAYTYLLDSQLDVPSPSSVAVHKAETGVRDSKVRQTNSSRGDSCVMRAGEACRASCPWTAMVRSEPLPICVRCVHIRNVANFKILSHFRWAEGIYKQ